MEPIRILIADDHTLFRDGLGAVFDSIADTEVVGEAATGDEAIAQASHLQPDIILMDIQMPGKNGIEATRRIVRDSPHIGIIIVTMFEDDDSVLAMRAGARGYVLKGADQAEMLRVIRAVARGEALFGPGIAARLMSFFDAPPPVTSPEIFPELTNREREVLHLIAQGHNNTEIATHLVLSPKTVRNHVSNIFSKLQVADRAQAIVRAREAGLGRETGMTDICVVKGTLLFIITEGVLRMTRKPKVFSGIQPSGTLHIGNYLGAIKNWASMLDDYDCVFGIVDYHAMTIAYDPAEMQQRIFDAACVNIACGLDPERCILFVQSHVPDVAELAWVFNTLTPMGLAGRLTQFKDKSTQHADNVNVGLFTYPILQAADILIYHGEFVPVGEDQVQHIEFSRDIARKFNNTYGDYFPEPQAKLTPAARIMGLDGQHKMSKSRDNYLGVTESPDEIWAKLRTAFTDPARLRRSDPGNPDICNIYTLHQAYSTPDEVAMIDRECRVAGIGCMDCKKILAAHIDAQNEPIRERYDALVADPDGVRGKLRAGADRARVIAEQTMADVYRLTGLR